MAKLSRPGTLPKNYKAIPAPYPDLLFRVQMDAARRYLFDGELKELLEASQIPLKILESGVEPVGITVQHYAAFAQGLREICDDDKALSYGHDAFNRCATLMQRPGAGSPLLRAVSSADKLFLKIKDSLVTFNRYIGTDVIAKWHGGAECDMFDDTAQACYGYTSDEPICMTMSGFLEAGSQTIAGVKIKATEVECMAKGAPTCRWHCTLG